MNVEEKKVLRKKRLKELYDYNEEHAGRSASITFTDLYKNDEDKQNHLAYEYLADKGLIDYKIMARNMYNAKITSRGIDAIENDQI